MSEFTVDLDGRGPVTEPIATDTPTISTRDAIAAACVFCGLATLTVAIGIGVAWWIGFTVLGALLLAIGMVFAYEPTAKSGGE